jgi:hypothetical protein
MISINPYDLLGITIDSTVADLKKSYYTLALLCHPDKGGDAADMNTLALSYKYLIEQLEHRSDKTYEEVEAEFDAFCKEQEQITPPDFAEIYGDAMEGFNRKFDENENNNNNEPFGMNPFGMDHGYGDLMEPRELPNDNDDEIELKAPKNKFSCEIQIYEEPLYCPGYLDNKYPLDITEKIKDYSGKNMADYYIAMNTNKAIIDNNVIIDGNVNEAYEKLLKLRSEDTF